MAYSMDEKIGQMIMVGFRGTEVNQNSQIIHLIKNYHLGGVWLVDNDSPMGHTIGNIQSPGQLQKLIQEMQAVAEIPLFVSIDAEGGEVIRLKEKYGFPATLSARYLGEQNDLSLTRHQALKIAKTLKQLGFNLNLSPVLDLNKNPNNQALGKKQRCFSYVPNIVIQHATQVIEAHHDQGIICGAKHFPGHGSARDDSHIDFVDVSETWSEDELIPYKELIKKGLVDAVLTAHVSLNRFDSQYPATLSKNIVTDILRKKLKFRGVVVSDDMNMGAIKKNFNYENALELALNAGVDIILQSNVNHYDEKIAEHTIEIIKKLVKSGKVSKKIIDESFKRIIDLKHKFNLDS